MKIKFSKNIKTVLDFLQDEVGGNSASAKRMYKEYSLTGMYVDKKNKKLFPTFRPGVTKMSSEIHLLQDRAFEVKNIAEGQNVITVEAVQCCFNSKTKKTYRVPVILIFEMKNGKILTGRHYFDPHLLLISLKQRQIEKAFKKSKGTVLTIK